MGSSGVLTVIKVYIILVSSLFILVSVSPTIIKD